VREIRVADHGEIDARQVREHAGVELPPLSRT
jgi:hypothetical protein